MYFSIGGHPAFNCPLFADETFEDYEIIFNEKETAGTHIVTEEGLVLDDAASFFDESNLIPLNYDLFRKYETLIFSNLKSTTAVLRSRKTGAEVAMDFSGFPYYGIWTPPGAPFICLEPWCGVNDSPTTTGNLHEKTGIIKLPAKSERSYEFVVSF
jgi:galactose mutarotase-like enzyme